MKYPSKLTKEELPSGLIVCCQRHTRFSYQWQAVAHSPSVSVFFSSLTISPFHALFTCYLSFSPPPPSLLPLPGVEEEWLLNDSQLVDWMPQLTFSPSVLYSGRGGAHWPSPPALYIVCSYCSWLLSSHHTPLSSGGHGCYYRSIDVDFSPSCGGHQLHLSEGQNVSEQTVSLWGSDFQIKFFF